MEHSAGDASTRPNWRQQKHEVGSAPWPTSLWTKRTLREGAPAVLALAAAGAVAIRLYPPAAPFAFLASAAAALAFRDPERNIVPRPGLALAPADGSVLHIARVWDSFWEAEMVEIAVFLALWDVHVQRSPLDCEIVAQHRRSGGYRPAMTHAATHGNNQLATYLRTASGRPCTVTQISGLLARRIVSWVGDGDRLSQGERLGMIKFGSQVTLRIPETSTVLVTKGDRVRAGLTPLAQV